MNKFFKLIVIMLLMFSFINRFQAAPGKKPSTPKRSLAIIKPAPKTYVAKPAAQPAKKVTPISTPRQKQFPYQSRYDLPKPQTGSSNKPFTNTYQPEPSSKPYDDHYHSINQGGIVVVPVYIPVQSDSNLQAPLVNQKGISFSPQLNCPTMPANTDILSDSEYQKTMNNFRQEKFNKELVNTNAKADKCEDQCKTEFQGKCYTGFTSDDNKCECATPKN